MKITSMQRHHILWYPCLFVMLKTIYPDGNKVLFNYTEIIGEHRDFDGHTQTHPVRSEGAQ